MIEKIKSFLKKAFVKDKDKSTKALKYTIRKNENNSTSGREFSSTVLNEVVQTFKDTPINTIFTRSEIVELVSTKYSRNPTSIIPSDYCYNRLNKGINYENYLHLFEYTEEKNYRYLGLNYPYTGKIIHKPKGGYEVVVGELNEGVLIPYENPREIINENKIKVQKSLVDKNTIKAQKSDDKTIHKTKRDIPVSLRYQILKRDNFKCCMCGASPATDQSIILHIDHIKPWSKGGETTFENLQTLCSKCNLGKSDLE